MFVAKWLHLFVCSLRTLPQPERVVVLILSRIREVPGSNLIQNTGYTKIVYNLHFLYSVEANPGVVVLNMILSRNFKELKCIIHILHNHLTMLPVKLTMLC